MRPLCWALVLLVLLVASSSLASASSKAPSGVWHGARSKAPARPPPDGGMGGPSVNPSHGHHHDAPGASPSGKPMRKPTGGEEHHG